MRQDSHLVGPTDDGNDARDVRVRKGVHHVLRPRFRVVVQPFGRLRRGRKFDRIQPEHRFQTFQTEFVNVRKQARVAGSGGDDSDVVTRFERWREDTIAHLRYIRKNKQVVSLPALGISPS